MNGTLYALLACFLCGIGARDQMLLAALTHRLGRHTGALLLACATSALASGLAAWASEEIGAVMTYPARMVLACFALAAAGVESLMFRPKIAMKEPTRSLFAAGVVMLAYQAADAARFLVLAITLATFAPVPTAVGGTLGAWAALWLGYLASDVMLQRESGLTQIRRWAGALLLGTGVGMGVYIWVVFGK
ncbi:hypothetical protein GTZ99_14510 [Novosphingobium sp. FSY-8]|uniref:GDT1 family protein n=1 Tax=Novosphingobium ovatum TaxID=1908523 RepID=A0ABW9XGS8_9SPHN|nr:hypothetical protein [Novosphingobium ovatum]NBC37764.1 hypothetical protein [Novosphingobium ovatum]